MSSERLRLVLRDLAAAAAFAAMAISGQVPLWTVALFVVALGVAISGRRPLSDGRVSAVALLVAVVVLYGAVSSEAVMHAATTRSSCSTITAP